MKTPLKNQHWHLIWNPKHPIIQYNPQIAPITSTRLPLNKTGSILPNKPSSISHQNSITPKLSLASDFQNTTQISQTYSLNFPQFKHLPTGAPQKECPNHPSLPNLYSPKAKGAPFQTSSNIPQAPQSPPEIK
ncbi:hypothetical protein O181_069839 [Austropuccinia psidii MF-1]|uniref:Uncharacterized protein n=1 Tax=Austropuccinia psidii MF-1 TaxID=1389203 RepID=A0A9Q3I8W8_9BASI|nr:hypothetical protein [Austropuccinia psidii MF-1]